jgi:hypothetical protein
MKKLLKKIIWVLVEKQFCFNVFSKRLSDSPQEHVKKDGLYSKMCSIYALYVKK